jgi:hypothetical protein
MNEKKNAGKNDRRTYRKPQLEQVQLVIEEALVTACKTGSGGSIPKCRPRASTCGRTPQRS